jgi:hypothetical protein
VLGPRPPRLRHVKRLPFALGGELAQRGLPGFQVQRRSPSGSRQFSVLWPQASALSDAACGICSSKGCLLVSCSQPQEDHQQTNQACELLGQSADEQAVHSVLAQLLAGGKVVIDSKGSVRYAFQSA